MSLEDQFSQLKAQLATAESEYKSLKLGRKSAAPRLRKSLMALKNGSHTMRAGTTSFVRELPTKSRTKADVKTEAKAENIVENIVESEVVDDMPVKKPRGRKKKIIEPSD